MNNPNLSDTDVNQFEFEFTSNEIWIQATAYMTGLGWKWKIDKAYHENDKNGEYELSIDTDESEEFKYVPGLKQGQSNHKYCGYYCVFA